MIWHEGMVSLMERCKECNDGEVKRTFFLSGPRSIEKRTFHLPCPNCRPQDYKNALARLRESLRQWELTISHVEKTRHADGAVERLSLAREELNSDGGENRSSSISI